MSNEKVSLLTDCPNCNASHYSDDFFGVTDIHTRTKALPYLGGAHSHCAHADPSSPVRQHRATVLEAQSLMYILLEKRVRKPSARTLQLNPETHSLFPIPMNQTRSQICPHCEGNGYIEIRDCSGEIQREETCYFCEGTGELIPEDNPKNRVSESETRSG